LDVYFISGMGADRRIFQKVKLSEKFRIHFLDWLVPLKNESIEAYAKRMSEKIDATKPFCIVGLSFGGVIACEISKIISPKKIVLVSSISMRKEIPWYYKLAGAFRLNKIPFLKYFKSTNSIFFWLLGAKTEEEKSLIRKVKQDANVDITLWAIDRFLHWQNKIRPENVFHIHGTSDRILPGKFVNADKKVIGGGHFMIFNRHEEVSGLIESGL
jgi:hypothetical protein